MMSCLLFGKLVNLWNPGFSVDSLDELILTSLCLGYVLLQHSSSTFADDLFLEAFQTGRHILTWSEHVRNGTILEKMEAKMSQKVAVEISRIHGKKVMENLKHTGQTEA